MTIPIFIVSSGRSGTQMMAKLLGALNQVEMHHEYLCTHIQPLAVKYAVGWIDDSAVVQALNRWYGAALHYCQKPFWGDSSNKLSWVIKPLNTLFPEARFIHLVRDGRKVVSSYFHKLHDEMYDDISTSVLDHYLAQPQNTPEPPPEKRYWWYIPPQGSEEHRLFSSYTRFQRICFHWGAIHRQILSALTDVTSDRQFTVKLEELVAKPDTLRDMLSFVGLCYRDELFEMFKRPHNVHTPIDRLLTPSQLTWLKDISGDMLTHFGYVNQEEYQMQYDHPVNED